MEPNWQLLRKRSTIEKRARILQQIRAFFIRQGFIEVETPHRIPANAPELHIDAFPSAGWFLQTSPELCMKRLLAAGYDNIFQICRCWRAGERSTRHLSEFTMLEWYRRDCDYRSLMTDCEQLITTLVDSTRINWQGNTIDMTPPWSQLTISEAFLQHSSISLENISDVNFFSELISDQIEPSLPKNKPLFLTDYPALQGALARRKPENPDLVERFELYIAGIEIANGFSELTDPVEQGSRFKNEERSRRDLGKRPCPIPVKYLEELETLPSAAGIALGVDRLIMLICNQPTIDDVVCFTPEAL